ncbi:MAG: sulfite exporter TauE/SafE family protein [Patescibacteria group bacterium]
MDKQQKIIVPIRGMHCRSCEILIEDELTALKGVQRAEADWRRSQVALQFSGQQPDEGQIREAIRRAGYEVGENGKTGFFSRNKEDYKDLGLAFLALLGIYLILKGLGISSININTSNDLTVPVILLIGLTAGFSTCMALVGGLILGVSARYTESRPEATSGEKFYPHLLFNSGRVIGFAVLGGILGLVGSAFQLSGSVLGFITIAAGLLMLVMGLQLTNIFPWLERFKLTLPKGLSRYLGWSKSRQSYSHNNAFILGALTFFLPCGFTQAMQIYAVSTGSFLDGAVVMGAFALGTMPGLLGIGGLTASVKGLFAQRFFKFAGLAVISFAFFNIANGLALSGFSPAYGSAAPAVSTDPNVTMENGVQVVRMTETASGYQPNSFTIKKGRPVRWVIDARDPYSCASTILLNKYGIRKNLRAGENVITFTPTEAGRLPFSCSMGMYTGVFNVIEDDNPAAGIISPALAAASEIAAPAPGGACRVGGCGGSGSGGCGCGGNREFIPSAGPVATAPDEEAGPGAAVQNITSVYTVNDDIVPNTFTVKAGRPVHYSVDVRETAYGCMSEIMIQNLYDQSIPLVAGEPLAMDFTPSQPGTYLITCAMGVPRGKIIVE